jgi:hypothetical protein
MLRKFGTWVRVDAQLKGLIVSSLGLVPVQKATKEFTTYKQREAFRKQLWQLSDLEVSSSSVSSFPAPPEKPELEANKRQRSATAGGFQEAGT